MKKNIILVESLKKNQKFYVSGHENKTYVIFITDGQNCEGDINIILNGEDTRIQILGIILGYGRQKINLYTLQDHLKERSISDLFIKSVLFHESKFKYIGLIKIEKYAQKSNAY